MQVLITILNNAKDAILRQRTLEDKHKGKIDIEVISSNGLTKIIILDNGCGIKKRTKQKFLIHTLQQSTKV